ncbi:MAG: hypothetical protein ACYC8T_03625 [Myxococcaceae bacterium]
MARKEPRPSPPSDAFERGKGPSAERVTAIPVAGPVTASIDSRIKQHGIDVYVAQRTQGAAGSVDVKSVRYQDDANGESGGNHNVYARILDASGKEIPPADLARYFDVKYTFGPGSETLNANPKLNDPYGVARDAWTNSANTGGPSAGYFDAPLWGGNQVSVWVEPKKVPGNPYADFGSQQTGPFSMPGNHHVNFLVTFQARAAGAAQQPAARPTAQVAQASTGAPSAQELSASASRIASYASSRSLGAPVDNGGGAAAHAWDDLTVQDFAGGSDTEGRCMVVDTGSGALLVRNDFYKHYLEGETHKTLGAPLDEEHWENGQVVQHFERGSMTWAPGVGTTVNASGGAAPAEPVPAQSAMGDLVESVYQSELGRASDPGGKANWVAFAEGQRARGKTDTEIRATLVAMFRQSDEFRARGTPAPANPSGPAPVDPTVPGAPSQPGSVYAPYEVTPGVNVNGRLGVHWLNTQYDNDMGRAQQIIDRMKQMGAGYCTLLVDPGNPGAQANLIQKLQENGITPVVRLYNGTPPDQWSDDDIQKMADGARALAAMGVKLVQVGNEPNLEGKVLERGISRADYLARSTERQAQALLAIRNAVGDSVKLGIPPMGCGSPDSDGTGTHAPQTYFPAMLQAIHRLEVQSGKRLCDWIPTHTYTMGQPGTDGQSQMGSTARGQLGWGPATGAWYEQQVRQVLGYPVKSLSTEGGSEPNAFRNNPDLVKGQMDEAMDQLQGNRNLTNCLWLLYDEEGLRSGNWGAWDKMALWDGEGAWGGGLSDYRVDYRQR